MLTRNSVRRVGFSPREALASPQRSRAKAQRWLRPTLLLLLTPLFLDAQPPGPDPFAENLFPPELVMAHQKAINLTEPQKSSIRADLLKVQTRFSELQWQLQDAMEGLVALLKQSPADEAQVMNTLDKILGFEREIKRSQIGLLVRIKNVLTTDQQAKLHRLRAETK